jgi:AcrR family transcriptional regulator
VLHYYFTDKIDLITHCVQVYNDECVTRYDEILTSARSATDLKRRFCEKLAATMADDADMHRLWYDLRNQALFEPAFQTDVTDIDLSLQRMIWRIVSRCGELRGHRPNVAEDVAYGMFDGLFEQALRRHLFGDSDARPRLRAQAGRMLDMMFD